MTMNLTILTPSKEYLKEQVSEIYLPGFLGEFGVLKGHARMVAALCEGNCRYRSSGGVSVLKIGKGVAKIFDDNIEVLTQSAEKP